MAADAPEAAGQRQRIDKWLFFARIVKSRSLAQKLVSAGHVSVNGQKITRSSAEIGPGDRLGVMLERHDLVLSVRAPGARRGPYEEARLLYEDLTPPPEARERFSALEQAQRAAGSGRPTKKDRRATDRLKEDGFG